MALDVITSVVKKDERREGRGGRGESDKDKEFGVTWPCQGEPEVTGGHQR